MGLLKILYNKFPREFARPYRIKVNNMNELSDLINKTNGTTRCFATVYDYHDKNRTPSITSVFIDLDDGISNARKIHKWLIERNIKHVVIFSGKGFHIYVFTEETTDKTELRGFQFYLEKELDVTVDHQVVGDLARIATIPFTLNTKRMRYAIPLSGDELLSLSEEQISEIAKQQRKSYKIEGEKLLKLEGYSKFFTNNLQNAQVNEDVIAEVKDDKFLSSLPKCVAYHLKKGNPNHRERGVIITYLMETGYTLKMIDSVLKKYLISEKYYHCVGKIHERYNGKKCENQLEYVYRKKGDDWFFPSHQTLVQNGFCFFKDCNHNVYV